MEPSFIWADPNWSNHEKEGTFHPLSKFVTVSNGISLLHDVLKKNDLGLAVQKIDASLPCVQDSITSEEHLAILRELEVLSTLPSPSPQHAVTLFRRMIYEMRYGLVYFEVYPLTGPQQGVPLPEFSAPQSPVLELLGIFHGAQGPHQDEMPGQGSQSQPAVGRGDHGSNAPSVVTASEGGVPFQTCCCGQHTVRADLVPGAVEESHIRAQSFSDFNLSRTEHTILNEQMPNHLSAPQTTNPALPFLQPLQQPPTHGPVIASAFAPHQEPPQEQILPRRAEGEPMTEQQVLNEQYREKAQCPVQLNRVACELARAENSAEDIARPDHIKCASCGGPMRMKIGQSQSGGREWMCEGCGQIMREEHRRCNSCPGAMQLQTVHYKSMVRDWICTSCGEIDEEDYRKCQCTAFMTPKLLESKPGIRQWICSRCNFMFEEEFRRCNNCGSFKTRQWVRGKADINEWLCHPCGQYWRKNGVSRPLELCQRPVYRRRTRAQMMRTEADTERTDEDMMAHSGSRSNI